jgi:hypothetical protein
MLEKLYDLFVSIVTFILGLFGFELSKRSVTFAEGTKEGTTEDTEESKDAKKDDSSSKEENVTTSTLE